MSARRAFIAGAACGVLAVAGLAASGATPLDKWRLGQNYQALPEPVPPAVAVGKVEVAEAFWYGCAHCFALDPVLEGWKATKPDYVEFVRVPVIWGPAHRQHAKLYYTVQALHRPDLHPKVFDVIHKDGAPLSDRDELVAREMHFAFFKRHGITQQQFDAAYDSMMVATNMQRAEMLTRKLGIDNVPLVFVNGRYVTSVASAGGEAQLIALINDLAQSEKR